MSEPKRQHIVPVSYLQNWSTNKIQSRKKSKVCVFDVNDGRSFITSVDKYPTEKYFYDIPEFGEKRQLLEKRLFSTIENDYATLLKKVLKRIEDQQNTPSKAKPILLPEDKSELAAQFAMQIVRTQAFRRFYQRAYTTLKEGFPWADIPAYANNDFQRLHTNEIMSFDMANFYANLLSDRNWVILINRSDTSFFTSDNPGIFINHSENSSEPISSVSEEVTFYMPLSPKVAVELYHKNIMKMSEMCIPLDPSAIVRGYNKNLRKACIRFMFSNKNDFSCLIGGEK